MKIQEAVASVQNAPGSMYTREDVISLLSKLEAPQESGRLTTQQVSDLYERIVAQVKENAENIDSDVIDKDSADFSLNYKEIELESVDIDTREIARVVVDGIGDVIDTFFEELEEEEKVEEVEEEVA
tara:strand:+ start:75 stop:455 length:381 start_codon:yes stop_codon:yes gene_type:complete